MRQIEFGGFLQFLQITLSILLQEQPNVPLQISGVEQLSRWLFPKENTTSFAKGYLPINGTKQTAPF